MVLQKVGETATEIQVNGTTEGNFTQVNDSVYDVSVSSNPRVRRQGTAGGSTSFQIVKTGGDIVIDKIDWYLRVGSGTGSGGFAELNSENGREVYVDDGSFGLEDNIQSGTIQDPNFSNLSFYVDDDTGSVEYDIEVYINGIDVNRSVDSVTKQ